MDIHYTNHGSLIGIQPFTDAGEEWLTEMLPDDVQCLGNVRYVEPRYATAIIDGMIDDGLEVAG